MYLIERMIGITIFSIILILIFLLLTKCNLKKSKIIIIIYIIILAIMAYFYVPTETTDLYRLISSAKIYYVSKSFPEIFNYAITTTRPVEILYLYIFGKIGIDGLFPAVTCIIFYSISFYILYKSSSNYNIKDANIAWTLLFFMLGGQYIEVISNIRCLLSFSIVALCIYREILENKSIIRNIILYILAIFLHSASLGIVAIRMIFLLFQNGKNGKKSFWNIILFLIIIFLFITFGLRYILSSYDKLLHYLSNDVYSYIWEYIVAILNVVIIIITLVKLKRLNYVENVMDNNMINLYKFIKLFLLILIIFFPIYSIFHRFRTFLMIIFIPLHSFFLQKTSEYKDNYDFSKYKTVFVVICFVLLILICTRGNLSGLKFFVL